MIEVPFVEHRQPTQPGRPSDGPDTGLLLNIKAVVTLHGATERSPLHEEESQEKINCSMAADMGGIFAVVATLHTIAVWSTLVDISQPDPTVSCDDL